MSLIRICESEDFVVDYDRGRGMYRVSVFKDNHFQDDYWFDCYEERELSSNDDTAIAINEEMVYITKKEYNELLEYKYMYEKLCE